MFSTHLTEIILIWRCSLVVIQVVNVEALLISGVAQWDH